MILARSAPSRRTSRESLGIGHADELPLGIELPERLVRGGVGECPIAVLDQGSEIIRGAQVRIACAGREVASSARAVDPENASRAVGDQGIHSLEGPACSVRITGAVHDHRRQSADGPIDDVASWQGRLDFEFPGIDAGCSDRTGDLDIECVDVAG